MSASFVSRIRAAALPIPCFDGKGWRAHINTKDIPNDFFRLASTAEITQSDTTRELRVAAKELGKNRSTSPHRDGYLSSHCFSLLCEKILFGSASRLICAEISMLSEGRFPPFHRGIGSLVTALEPRRRVYSEHHPRMNLVYLREAKGLLADHLESLLAEQKRQDQFSQFTAQTLRHRSTGVKRASIFRSFTVVVARSRARLPDRRLAGPWSRMVRKGAG
jgi:hypothetical protein